MSDRSGVVMVNGKVVGSFELLRVEHPPADFDVFRHRSATVEGLGDMPGDLKWDQMSFTPGHVMDAIVGTKAPIYWDEAKKTWVYDHEEPYSVSISMRREQ